MGKSSSQPVPDPRIAIQEQGRQNRISTSSPFGGQQFNQNPDGSWRQDTSLSPAALQMAQMNSDEALHNRDEYQAPGLDMLTQALMGRVGQSYGINNLQNAQAKPQQQTPSGPQLTNPEAPTQQGPFRPNLPPWLANPGG